MDNAVRLWNAVFDRQRIRLVDIGFTGLSMVTDISLIRDDQAPLCPLSGDWALSGIDFSYPMLQALQAVESIIVRDPSPRAVAPPGPVECFASSHVERRFAVSDCHLNIGCGAS